MTKQLRRARRALEAGETALERPKGSQRLRVLARAMVFGARGGL